MLLKARLGDGNPSILTEILPDICGPGELVEVASKWLV